MSGTRTEEETTKDQELTDSSLNEHDESVRSEDEQKELKKSNENAMPSPQLEPCQCRNIGMSDTRTGEETTKDQELTDSSLNEHDESVRSEDEQKELKKSNENSMPSPQLEEEVIKKKYGGIIPKKTPLIAKDHERAFFDSADWALGKGSQKPKGPLEALLPKLQPTTHQQVRSRHSAHGPADADDSEDGGNNNETSSSSLDTTSKDLSAPTSNCMM